MGGVVLRNSKGATELRRGRPPHAQPSPDIQKYQTIHAIASAAPTFTRRTSMGITLTPTVRSTPPYGEAPGV